MIIFLIACAAVSIGTWFLCGMLRLGKESDEAVISQAAQREAIMRDLQL